MFDGSIVLNWEAAGAVGEIIGAVAVIGTLIYLSLQIRQQNLAQQLGVKESILEGFNRANEHLATNPELASLFIRGLHNPGSLSDNESAQFSWLLRLFVNQYLKMYDLYLNKSLSLEDWQNYASQGAWMMKTLGGQKWLEGHGSTFTQFYEELMRHPFDESSIDFTMGRDWRNY